MSLFTNFKYKYGLNINIKKIFNYKIIIARLRLFYSDIAFNKNKKVSVHGIDLHVDLNDFPSQAIYAYRSMYENETIELCRQVIKPGMFCIDVGSNIGLFSSIFAELVGDSGKVFCYEVNHSIIKTLKKNMNKYNNSFVYNEYISNKKELISYVPPSRKFGNIIEYYSKTLDEHVSEKVDFIKIDIDGKDLRVLQGAENVISRHKPLILVEISEDSFRSHNIHFLEIIEFLGSFGYQTFYASKELKQFYERKLPTDTVMNLFFKQ